MLAHLRVAALLDVPQPMPKACLHSQWTPIGDGHVADVSAHLQEALDFTGRVREMGGKILVTVRPGFRVQLPSA